MKHLKSLALVFSILASPAIAGDIYVDAIAGNDMTGNGSVTSPFKTITVGVGYAMPFDTVHVNPGIYDLTNGEYFPIYLMGDVTLTGAGPNLSIIDGVGATFPGQSGLVMMTGNGEVSGFTFRNGPMANHWDSAVARWGAANVTVHDCVFAGPNLKRAIVCYDQSGATGSTAMMYNNIAYDINKEAYVAHDYANLMIFNNTSANAGGAAFLLESKNVAVTGQVASNIAFGSVKWAFWGSTLPAVSLANNCMYNNGYGPTKGTFGSETGTVASDPQFVSETDNDFHILPTSPCVNAGLTSGILTDLDGENRMFDGTTDIGADEMCDPSTYIRSPMEQGKMSAIVTLGSPGASFFQVLGAIPATVPTGYGMLYMDPNYMIIFMVGGIQATGAHVTPVPIPPAPAYVGIPLIVQSMVNYTLSGAQTITLL